MRRGVRRRIRRIPVLFCMYTYLDDGRCFFASQSKVKSSKVTSSKNRMKLKYTRQIRRLLPTKGKGKPKGRRAGSFIRTLPPLPPPSLIPPPPPHLHYIHPILPRPQPPLPHTIPLLYPLTKPSSSEPVNYVYRRPFCPRTPPPSAIDDLCN